MVCVTDDLLTTHNGQRQQTFKFLNPSTVLDDLVATFNISIPFIFSSFVVDRYFFFFFWVLVVEGFFFIHLSFVVGMNNTIQFFIETHTNRVTLQSL